MSGEGSGWLRRWVVRVVILAVAWACLASAAATAADQFTIDPKPDSFAPIVTDAAGNGYVAWEHAGTGAAADKPMFCRLSPGAGRCVHPISLVLPGSSAGPEANALAPFPVLGSGSTVWVVTSRYAMNDIVVWTSTDGGSTFGPPHVIPYIINCPAPCPFVASFPYSGQGTLDDVLPDTRTYATYGRQLYTDTKGQFVYFMESSYNPDLGFNVETTDEIAAGPAGVSEFTFANPGAGGIGDSALGTTAVGETVEAYSLEQTPPKLAYYSFHANNPDPISPQNGWSGPNGLGAGDLPRMAEGAAGLFLLSEDSSPGAAQPTIVDLRQYSTASHTFGPPHTLVVNPSGASYLFSGGGLDENYATGELAALWPQFSTGGTSSGFMRLFLSNDGGSHFSPSQDVAAIAGGYSILDNARIAIADNGTGFLTFQDSAGMQVADLFPIAAQYSKFHRTGTTLRLRVTCPAPKGRCKVTIRMTGQHAGRLALARFTITAGATAVLKLRLLAQAVTLLQLHHGRLLASLSVTVKPPGAKAHTTTAAVTI